MQGQAPAQGRMAQIGAHDRQLDPFADAIGGEFRWQVEGTTQGQHGVSAVHGRLVDATANPPTGGPRPTERPHPCLGPNAVDGIDDELGAGVEPFDRTVGILGRLAVAHLARIKRLAPAFGDDLRRPPIAPPDVFEQLVHGPAGAGRHRSLGVGVANDVTEGPGLLEQRCAEVHA